MWDLIVSVPDHCLSFYFTALMAIYGHWLYGIQFYCTNGNILSLVMRKTVLLH